MVQYPGFVRRVDPARGFQLQKDGFFHRHVGFEVAGNGAAKRHRKTPMILSVSSL
jgi:hypothetical protein